jgi:hypothetical protein
MCVGSTRWLRFQKKEGKNTRYRAITVTIEDPIEFIFEEKPWLLNACNPAFCSGLNARVTGLVTQSIPKA